MTRFKSGALGLAVLATLTITACSSDKKSSSTTAASATTAAGAATTAAGAATTVAGTGAGATTVAGTAAAADAVSIKGFKFIVPASVAAGSTVTIKNDDQADHTFTDKGGKFDVKVPAGGTATFTAPAAGTYQLICHIHPSMSGTLVVA
jgi:plastocyanin